MYNYVVSFLIFSDNFFEHPFPIYSQKFHISKLPHKPHIRIITHEQVLGFTLNLSSQPARLLYFDNDSHRGHKRSPHIFGDTVSSALIV